MSVDEQGQQQDGTQLSPALEKEFVRLSQKLPSNITNIVPATLQEFIKEEGNHPLIIVDVRTPEGGLGLQRSPSMYPHSVPPQHTEREVSRLPGPVVSKEEFEADKTKYKNHRVVCYCTAGFRSGQYTGQLVNEGFADVYNLKGSVLAWVCVVVAVAGVLVRLAHVQHVVNTQAEAGLPFVDGQDGTTQTNKVHTYGATWAPFLDKNYEPVTFSVFQYVCVCGGSYTQYPVAHLQVVYTHTQECQKGAHRVVVYKMGLYKDITSRVSGKVMHSFQCLWLMKIHM